MNKGHCEQCLSNLVNHRYISDLEAENRNLHEMLKHQMRFIKTIEDNPDIQARDAVAKARQEFES